MLSRGSRKPNAESASISGIRNAGAGALSRGRRARGAVVGKSRSEETEKNPRQR